ncbi:MAG: 30S ribosomal protein S20 [Butyricicoccus sp.]
MPNIKSAKKRVKVNSVKALNNQMAKSELKTTLKKFDAAIAGGDKAEATAAYTSDLRDCADFSGNTGNLAGKSACKVRFNL